MRDIQFEERGREIAITDIAAFERFLGRELPNDYKKFLEEHNGGYPEEELAFPIGDEESVLSHFYCLGDDLGDILGLRECWDNFVGAKRISSNYLPIADDAFGNQLCLDLSDKTHGSIVFWDHEANSNEVIWVAHSFSDFCKKLQPLPE